MMTVSEDDIKKAVLDYLRAFGMEPDPATAVVRHHVADPDAEDDSYGSVEVEVEIRQAPEYKSFDWTTLSSDPTVE